MKTTQKKEIIVCGSIAYDIIFSYDQRFQDALVDHEHISVAFSVKEKEMFFGGCGANIVIHGNNPTIRMTLFGIAGKDFGPYKSHLTSLNIDSKNVILDKRFFTSQATITTDPNSQQLIFFYEGAAANALQHEKKIDLFFKKQASKTIFVHIGPNSPAFIKLCVAGCLKYKIPYFFDPGQATAAIKDHDLKLYISHAQGFFANEYEMHLFQQKTGLTITEVLEQVRFAVVTRAENGSDIYYDNKIIHIPAKKTKKPVVDPTGCGDAYRGQFLAEMGKEWPNINASLLTKAGIKGSVKAAECITRRGPH